MCAGVWPCQQQWWPPSAGASCGGVPLLQAETSRSTLFSTWFSLALAQPSALLLLESFYSPISPEFHFWVEMPRILSAEVLVTGMSPHAVQRALGQQQGSVLRWQLGQAVHVEHKSSWRQGRSEQEQEQ